MKSRLISLSALVALVAIACATVFVPQDMTITRGSIVSGNLFSLSSSDNDRLVIKSGIKATIYDNPIDFQSQVVCGQPNPTSMTLRLETSASTVGLVEYVEMFNWTTNRFEEVYQGPISRNETARQIPVPNGGRFTGNVGQMRVRYWVDQKHPVATIKWTVAIDELTWDVNF